jgi:putative oxidoreductase
MASILTGTLALRRLTLAVAERLAWLPPTLARFTVGWIFLWSGWGKLHDLDGVIQFFTELGIPHPELQAPFASGNELVCGALLLIGLCTRVATIPLVIVMFVALATAQRENVSSLGDLFGLSEYLYVTLLVWIGVAGPGPLSVDALLVRRFGEPAAAARRTNATASVGGYERTARA